MSIRDSNQIQMNLALDEMESAKRMFKRACDRYHRALIQSECNHQWTHRLVESIIDDYDMDSWHCEKCSMRVFFNPGDSNE